MGSLHERRASSQYSIIDDGTPYGTPSTMAYTTGPIMTSVHSPWTQAEARSPPASHDIPHHNYIPELGYNNASESPVPSSASVPSVGSMASPYMQGNYSSPYSTPQVTNTSLPMSASLIPRYGLSKYEETSNPYSMPNLWSSAEATEPQVADMSYDHSFIQPVGTIPFGEQSMNSAHPFIGPPLPISDDSYLDGGRWALTIQQLVDGGGMVGVSPAEEWKASVNMGVARVNQYLELYWQNFDPLFSIVHRPTFSTTRYLLVASMVMIGAQYAPGKESRVFACSLHQGIKLYMEGVSHFLASHSFCLILKSSANAF
jgi:Fungal specific transcription factor domain